MTTSTESQDAKKKLPPGFGLAFGLTWLSYASYYFGRKGLSVVKAPLMKELGDDALLGVETAFLAAYAVGQYLCGWLGDRIGSRRLIGVGMLVSAAACVLFGMSSLSIVFIIAFGLNGLAQASGWPGNIKAMAEWTTPQNRGAVMGFWATCYQVGGVAASAIAARILVVQAWPSFAPATGWRAAMVYPGVWVGVVGIAILLLLKQGPGLTSQPTSSDESQRDASSTESADKDALRKEAQRAVLRNPAVWSYGASYFFIKLIRYSLLFWLPFYLSSVLHYTHENAGYMSTSFEIGGVVGTIALGSLSDRYRQLSRSMYSALSLVGLAGALLLYAQLGGTGEVANFVAMAFVGALLYGPDALLSGASAQDAGGPHGAAIAAGMVNGLGSLGAVLQELVTRGVSKRFGWDALFYTFVAMALLAAVALIPTFKRPAQPTSA
ncbi:MAG: MFS transporter [Polyangiaceae bacterium]